MSTSKVTVKQIKAARALLGWSQTDHAEKSKVSLPTIKRLEAQGGNLGGLNETSKKLIDALISEGIRFISNHPTGIGVALVHKTEGIR